jgi:hypothetical protein
VLVTPSPKVHPYVYGAHPPDGFEVKETGCPTTGCVGEKVKSTATGAFTVTVWVAVAEAVVLSVTVNMTEYANAEPKG